jgi:hypothetical protein
MIQLSKSLFCGRRQPKMVRINEEVHQTEWPRGRSPRALREMEADGQESVEVYSVEVYPEEVWGPSPRPS